MNMLIEKRKVVLEKMELLEADRQRAIDEKVSRFLADVETKVRLYRESLMAGYDEYVALVESSEVLNPEYVALEKVLSALDEVIAYENVVAEPVKEEVKEFVAEPIVAEEVAPIAEEVVPTVEILDEHNETINIEPEAVRPGMAYIGVPDRR